MRDQIIRLGCAVDKVKYVVYGPSDVFFGCKPSTGYLNFLSVGRFVDKKAPYYTIMAFALVHKRFPDAHLWMAGDGPLLNACINLVRCLKLNDVISFIGVITPQEMAVRLESTLAFVQHSIIAANGDREGTPVALLEAAAAGVAIVSTFHEGISDVFRTGETALLVDEHDVDGMAAAMMQLIQDRGLAAKLGASAREHIRRDYNMSQYIAGLAAVIREVVKA
jgi:glycosyltransferase involved in cell wall biosynthesis